MTTTRLLKAGGKTFVLPPTLFSDHLDLGELLHRGVSRSENKLVPWRVTEKYVKGFIILAQFKTKAKAEQYLSKYNAIHNDKEPTK